jgi:peptide-methionine (S)-S-oxide reductase
MMMFSRSRFGLGLVLALLAQLALAGGAARPAAAAQLQTIVLAGGCFWGQELVFENLKGVKEAMPGYSGGSAATAHYELTSTGTTGHAESVRVTYDPAEISLQQILTVFFTVSHDPTELNYQGPDDGTQYRSAIFIANDEQRQVATAMIARLTAEHRFSAPIVTKLEPFHGFYPAEQYHRHYAVLHPDDPYIVENDLPKLAALKKTYPQLLAQK